MDSGTGVYRIGTAARMVGVEVATLRNWEQRYAVVVATRGSGRQRLYSAVDIDRLRTVKHWMDGGLSASEAHTLLREEALRLRPRVEEPGGWQVRDDARRLRAEAVQAHARAAAARANAALLDRLAERAEARREVRT